MTSERLDLYQVVAQWLVEQEAAYPCFCSPARLDQLRADQQAAGQPPRYDRHCRHLSATERQASLAAGVPAVIRLAMPLEGTIAFTDPARGPITFTTESQDDSVLLKSDGYPTYHLAAPTDAFRHRRDRGTSASSSLSQEAISSPCSPSCHEAWCCLDVH